MGYRPAENQLTLFGADPHQIIRDAWEQHGHQIIRRTAMLSGGNDSSTLAHWLAWNGYVDELLFLNTGTGIRETTRFVRRLADHLELPLQEWHAPPGTYERMVTTISGGFPGPAAHSIAYQRLKERPLRDYVALVRADASVVRLLGLGQLGLRTRRVAERRHPRSLVHLDNRRTASLRRAVAHRPSRSPRLAEGTRAV
jgi:3'-phosphoadenosine 5'-phosphosulfate sulfotransferase (PAPS reductase)/FAD synthetase